MKKVILVLIFFFVGIAGFSQDYDKNTLRGIDGFRITINIENIEGLSEWQIRTDVELKLRMAGILVDGPTSYKYPELRVIVLGGGEIQEEFYSYATRVEVHQGVIVIRKDYETYLATWSVFAIGQGGLSDIRDLIKDLIDTFLNAYLSVNPK